jgi:signal transduction histidine kinase/DNA-binding response OmpR family regulator
LETVVDSIPGAIVLHDGRGRTLFANRFLREVADLPSDRPEAGHLAQLGLDVGPLAVLPGPGAARAAVWREGELQAGDGRCLPVLQTRLAVAGPQGNSYLTIALDRSDRRQAELEARSSQAELAALLRSIPGTVMKISSDHEVLLSSDPLDDQRLGHPLKDWFLAADHSRLHAAIESARGEAGTAAAELRRAEAPHERIELRVTRMGGQPGPGAAQFTAIATSIESLRKAELARRELEREMSRVVRLESLGFLAGSVAHDFNNLLTGILGNTELAAEATDNPVVQSHLDDVRMGSLRAADLCRQLLAYAGRGGLQAQALDVSQVVRQIVGPMQPRLSPRAQVDLELAEDLPPIQGDAMKIQQVVMNLMANASDALIDGSGHLEVRTEVRTFSAEEMTQGNSSSPLPAGEYVVVAVGDDGRGIEPDKLTRVFEPFYSTKKQGTGLGLAAAHGLVHSQGGAICVHSTPGQGTRFELLFPVRRDLNMSPAEGPRLRAGLSRGRVLVVDSEVLMRDLARAALSKAGYEVAVAEDWEQASGLLERSAERESAPGAPTAPDDAPEISESAAVTGDPDTAPPTPGFDCIVLGLTMPRRSGEGIFGALEQRWPELPVVLLSGYSQERLGRAMRRLPFVSKPFRPAELVRVVQAVCSAAEHRPKGEERGESMGRGC